MKDELEALARLRGWHIRLAKVHSEKGDSTRSSEQIALARNVQKLINSMQGRPLPRRIN